MTTRPNLLGSEASVPVVRVDHSRRDAEVIAQAARRLQGGGVVGMRTDTVYGLLASVNRPDALRRLVEMKARPEGKPFILLAADWIGVRSVTSYLPPVARLLGSKYWPGPLTLVLPGEESLPEEVRGAGPTVAVRIPRDSLLLEIVREARAALAAPSANLPGEPPARTAAELVSTFGRGVDLVLDGGPAEGESPSTLVNCCGSEGEVLREGPIKLSADELAPS